MSTYLIDYSEPLRPSFEIPQGGLNGPGGANANSTLRLYGRGAIEWGEAVDEDLLRLSENFAAASPPSLAISGQFWVETKLYYHNSSLTSTTGWYRWNFATNNWGLLNGNGVVGSIPTTPPSIGQYYYGQRDFDGESVTGLWGYYSLGRYEPPNWLPRATIEGVGTPSSTLTPTHTLKLRDGTVKSTLGTSGAWVLPGSTPSNESPPTAPSVGMLWYQPSTGILYVYSADTSATGLLRWQAILGPSRNGSSIPAANGPISMKDPNTGTNHKITNVATPTTDNDAVNKKYVDDTVSTGQGNKVSRSGDTMTGPLIVNALTTLSQLTVSGTVNLNQGAKFSGILDMGNNKIVNLATPTNNQDAASKQYVDQAVSSQSQIDWASIINFMDTHYAKIIDANDSYYKAGDIYPDQASNSIWIALSSGGGMPPSSNWKQIWPATYS